MNAQDDRQPLDVTLEQTARPDRLKDSPLRKFFEQAIKHAASDLIVKPAIAPRLRVDGELRSLKAKPFTERELLATAEQMFTPAQMAHFRTHGALDMAYDYDEDNRFRVNVFLSRGRISIAARRVSSEILDYAQLHLPPVLEQIAEAHHGLVLLCGVTGSGKSTTIASMLQQINERRACHVVTLEDPIEYIFKDARAVVSQREVGVDVPDFSTGLRTLVRENPDVVLIGELRDRQTFEAAVQAAETGHLVFGTVHASSASQAFGRVYNLFPPNERDLIREMFAANMKAVIYQRLLPCLAEGVARVPAAEVLINNAVVAKYIADSREAELGDVIRDSGEQGMLDLTSSLVDLVQKEYIHPRVAISSANNADELKMRLKGIRTSGS